MALDNLVTEFGALSEADKMAFFKRAMPSLGEICRKDPERMMNEMMPTCRMMMQSSGMDMERMRRMMGSMMGETEK